jgi:uncharacterized damage-inducible protein DinB
MADADTHEAATDEQGRPEVPMSGDEAATLLGFLDYQRATLAWKCRGLTDDQLRVTVASSVISLGGLLVHMARVEDGWFSEVVAEQPELEPWASMPWAAEWTDPSTAAATGAELSALWEQRVAASRRVVAAALAAGEAELGATHPAWGGQGHPSLRWVLVHMIEEYARHNGHADLIREAIDGETGE